ncbi:MAG: phospho-sugar mutase, partial [Acholeplasmataceae bacterium]|nr:phospho-sugar mutase [Acholeplasmataceae bacterium]
ASSFDQKVITTLTGFKFIGEQAEKIKDYGVYVFGCEESYGSLIADFVRDKDAVQAVFLLAEIANQVKQEKKTLVDYLSVIYQTYGYYYEYTENIMLEGSVGLAMIQAVMDHFRSSPPKLKSLELLSYDDFAYQIHIENRTETPLDLPASNVLKFYYRDHTWIVFRPSGTEPKLKIYYGTRQKSIDEARKFVQNLNQTIRDEIDQILKGESHAYQT